MTKAERCLEIRLSCYTDLLCMWLKWRELAKVLVAKASLWIWHHNCSYSGVWWYSSMVISKFNMYMYHFSELLDWVFITLIVTSVLYQSDIISHTATFMSINCPVLSWAYGILLSVQCGCMLTAKSWILELYQLALYVHAAAAHTGACSISQIHSLPIPKYL